MAVRVILIRNFTMHVLYFINYLTQQFQAMHIFYFYFTLLHFRYLDVILWLFACKSNQGPTRLLWNRLTTTVTGSSRSYNDNWSSLNNESSLWTMWNCLEKHMPTGVANSFYKAIKDVQIRTHLVTFSFCVFYFCSHFLRNISVC